MRVIRYWKFMGVLLLVMLTGCATQYDSLKIGGEAATYELIVAEEQDILDAAYEAIKNRFPDTIISGLAGNEKGFTFYTQPLLDRTTYKFLIERTEGITSDGKSIPGYHYSVYAQGTQFFVKSRYVDPLISELKRMLKKKGVTRILVQAIKIGQEKLILL